jgi:hypothetical protein
VTTIRSAVKRGGNVKKRKTRMHAKHMTVAKPLVKAQQPTVYEVV